MKKYLLFLLAISCGLLLSATALPRAHAQDKRDSSGAQVPNLATIFWGIVGYTRWPDTKKPLRICVSGEDRRTTRIRQTAAEIGREVIVVSSLTNMNTCDIVYAYNMNTAEMTNLLRSLTGARAVLTIGEGAAFCTAGGMFCLLPKGSGDGEIAVSKFAVNLDAISRSGLRIDPQVLRLSKQRQESK